MSAYKFRVEQDGANRRLLIKLVDPTTGATISTAPFIQLRLDDMRYATASGSDDLIEACFRRVHFTDPNDGLPKRCYALMTAAESDATDDGHSDSEDDLYLGGGGGAGIMCQITQLFGVASYFGVKRFDGTSQSGSQLLVAKSIPARPATGPYTYTGVDDNNRDSYNGSTHEAQVMTEPFTVGDVVWADMVDHTMVTVSGTELKLIEKNTLRGWTKPSES